MLPGTADRLQLAFTNLNNGHVIQVPQLTRNHLYPVVGARMFNGQCVSTDLFTLRSEGDIILKVYLPRRYGELVDDIDIEDINKGRKMYILIFMGMSGPAYLLHLQK